MRVKELVIDGFKSYATRTVISDWDESFNCITGLNGSGKSNILDAICFVLGITSMSTVRAHSQQDLIYKRGQAGVTKASVTIVFDNRDRAKSPVGFEDQNQISVTRQIVLGGTSKYLLNGHRIQQTDIKKMFQSVQLNIDSPNFLIMQGKITKVLNMSPKEILALIEEAAGTRMFETRRENALKTLAKKDNDINYNVGLLSEEIEPKLNKLRMEKQDYLEFQRCQSSVDRAEKLVYAHDYLAEIQKIARAHEDSETFSSAEHSLKQSIKSCEDELAESAEKLYQLTQQRKAQGTTRNLETLEEKHQEAAQEIARLQSGVEMNESSVSGAIERGKAAEKALSTNRDRLATFNEEITHFKSEYETLQTSFKEIQTQAFQKRDLLSSLETGLSAGGRETGYAKEAKRARDEISRAHEVLMQSEQRKEHLLKSNDPQRVQEARGAMETLIAKASDIEREAKDLQDGLDTWRGNNNVSVDDLKAKESKIKARLADIDRQIDDMTRKHPNMDFHAPGFPKGSVQGTVANLFKVKPEDADKTLALEISAGGRLYNVVVDSDVTGSKLLSSGLKRRITVLPLNKIIGNVLSSERVSAAKSVAPGKVELALDVISYKHDIQNAMKYVFGNTLLCTDANSAKDVTFDPRVRAKSVTLDGNIYDPQGTLSGGSRPETRSFLTVIQLYNELKDQRELCAQELADAQQERTRAQSQQDEYTKAQRHIDIRKHELAIIQEKIQSGPEAQLLRDATAAEQDLTGLYEVISRTRQTIENQTKLLRQTERDAAEFTSNKEEKLNELRGHVDELRSEEERLANLVQQNKQKYEEIEGELDQIKGDIQLQEEKVAQSETSLRELKAEAARMLSDQSKLQLRLMELERDLEEERSNLRTLDSEVNTAGNSIEEKKVALVESKLSLEKTVKQLAETTKIIAQSKENIGSMESEYPWLVSDKHILGEPNTPYDFSGSDIAHLRQGLKTESSRLNSLHHKVNAQVMSMMENVEKREESLRNMIKQIEHDKRSIEETVKEIDGYKQEALENTWGKVSEDLGYIFGELLPGSSAKLDLLEGKQVQDGLLVKVRLGSVWKDGLAELSGGQRSLVALSLILALLQFRPAPMYILDEVDAALDLHHTQNIGHIIKTKFSESQFIVVSLKDGMFTNANKIFQTRFQEGTSAVMSL